MKRVISLPSAGHARCVVTVVKGRKYSFIEVSCDCVESLAIVQRTSKITSLLCGGNVSSFAEQNLKNLLMILLLAKRVDLDQS